ncbi:YdgA family protein [Parapusillimonas sp. SGNA-6]|nr:YdgA family protein [Parapusillimonas sp. SGNA-6]
MKKSSGVIGGVVILAAVWLGTTWYVGKQAQAKIEDVVVQANQRLVKMLGPDIAGSDVKVMISDYRRRLFTADVVYTISGKDESGQVLELVFQDHLQHGPFPIGALRDGSFRPMLAHSQARLLPSQATQKWFDSQKGASPVQIETRIGFDGAGSSVWTLAPTEIRDDEMSLSFSGGTLDVQFSNDFQDSTATGHFEALSRKDVSAGESVQIKNIKLDSKTTTDAQDVVQVQTKGQVDTVILGDGAETSLRMDEVAIHLDSRQAGNMLDGTLRYDFGKLAVGASDLGSVSVGGKVQRLDVAALAALTTEYDAINARHGIAEGDEMIALTPEEETALWNKLTAVLKNNPAVTIDPLVWKNAQGETKALLSMDLTAPDAAGSRSLDVLLSQALKRLALDVSISKPMIIQAFGQAQPDAEAKLQMEMMGAMIYDQYALRLQQAGLIQIVDDTAKGSLVYENNAVVLNGKSMSVGEFMQRALSVAM